MSIRRYLVPINWISTILFNLKVFPLRTAIRLPIHLYGKVITRGTISGSISFTGNKKPHFGGWTIGNNADFLQLDNTHPNQTIFVIEGKLILGEYGKFANGTMTRVSSNGVLKIGSKFWLNYNSKIGCETDIEIGENVRLSWECQVFDTDFHYVIDSNHKVKNKLSKVLIGDDCWIGNRCSINKGTMLAKSTIVASNSLVNKDFSSESNCVLAGMPAKCVAHGYRRIYGWASEQYLNQLFQNSNNDKYIVLENDL